MDQYLCLGSLLWKLHQIKLLELHMPSQVYFLTVSYFTLRMTVCFMWLQNVFKSNPYCLKWLKCSISDFHEYLWFWRLYAWFVYLEILPPTLLYHCRPLFLQRNGFLVLLYFVFCCLLSVGLMLAGFPLSFISSLLDWQTTFLILVSTVTIVVTYLLLKLRTELSTFKSTSGKTLNLYNVLFSR